MPDGIQVQMDQLPTVARGWDTNSEVMGGISSISGDLAYRDDPGLFAGFVRLYNALPVEVARLCEQGSRQMLDIAQAIMASYHNYENTEGANIHLTQGL
jgi:hypothetical protein